MKLKTLLIPLVLASATVVVGGAHAASQDSAAGAAGGPLNQAEARLGEAVTAAKHFVRSAYAEMTDRNDAAVIELARVSLGEAVAAAERQVGGKAVRAEFDVDDGHAVFNVEVEKGGEVSDVTVDAQDGRILQARADGIDCPHEGDEHRDGRDD